MKYKIAIVSAFIGLSQPALAEEINEAKDGVRIEVRSSWETPTISNLGDSEVYKVGQAFTYGGEVGFDFAVSDSLVVGPYVTYEISNVAICGDGACLDVENSLSAGLHGGASVSESGLVYLKLGYAQMKIAGEIVSGGALLRETATGKGFGGAIGYEHSFTDNIYGRVEFGYADVGDIGDIAFQRRHAGLAIGARF